MRDTGKIRVAESPEIGMSEAEIKQFSFCRAMLAAADPVNAARVAPFEMEASRAAQDKRGDSRDKIREAATTIPVDVLSRGLVVPQDMARSAARMLLSRVQRNAGAYGDMMRDLVVGTPTAGGNLVATELLAGSFIELLRNAMVLDRLGVTMLRDLNGNIAIPAQTGGATGYWVGENTAITSESQQTIGQVTLTPKTVGAYTDFSRRLLLQSSHGRRDVRPRRSGRHPGADDPVRRHQRRRRKRAHWPAQHRGYRLCGRWHQRPRAHL
jgi:predicted phage gp36 major capsid-like protein